MQNKTIVSVYVLAYNHQNYIGQALESIVTQKTSFPFEVIVHDDASTDNTADIIREYEKKYPETVKPIYQTENQYSKRVPIFWEFIYPRITGRYVAVCEGDDYWVDPLKLQKQIDYMETHPDCTLCFTNGWVEDQTGKNPKRKFIPFHDYDKPYYVDENRIITLDNSYQMSFIPTASFVMRRDSYEKLPETYNERCMHGDLKMRLFHTALGYGYYMTDITCTYRQNVPGSAMTRWRGEPREVAYLRCKLACSMIDNVDAFTDYKHTQGLWSIQKLHMKGLLMNAPSLKILFNDLKNEKSKKALKAFTFTERIKMYVKAMLSEAVVDRIKALKRYFTK